MRLRKIAFVIPIRSEAKERNLQFRSQYRRCLRELQILAQDDNNYVLIATLTTNDHRLTTTYNPHP